MSKLSKFLGTTIFVEVRGESLKLYPLTVKEMGMIDRLKEITDKGNHATNEEKEELAKISKDIVKISYKDEAFTDDEIERMDISMYAELYAAIMENITSTQDGKGFDRIRKLKEKVIQDQPK